MTEPTAAEKAVNEDMRPVWLRLNLAQRCMVLEYAKKLAGNIVPQEYAVNSAAASAAKPSAKNPSLTKPAATKSSITSSVRQFDQHVNEAIQQCEMILGLCEEIPDAGVDFADSVIEKVESIKDWIESNGTVTEAQQDALDNMESGVSRWLR